jgi:hypothetical protein
LLVFSGFFPRCNSPVGFMFITLDCSRPELTQTPLSDIQTRATTVVTATPTTMVAMGFVR